MAAHRERFGTLDLLVNASGVGFGGPIDGYPTKRFDLTFGVNIRGLFLVTREALPLLRASRGRIVNLASIAGLQAEPGLAIYAATKHAVVGLSRSLSEELFDDGVRVTALCPGFVDTPMSDFIKEQIPAGGDGAGRRLREGGAVPAVAEPGREGARAGARRAADPEPGAVDSRALARLRAMTAIAPTGPRAQGVRWDLSRIVTDAAAARTLAEETRAACDAFAERYRGRIAELDAAGLAAALAEIAEIDNAISRAGSYVGLRRSVDVNDDEARDLEAVIEQQYVQIAQHAALLRAGVDRARRRPRRGARSAPDVARDSHHLRSLRKYKPHKLSEDEERVWAERSPAAQMAWQNLFEQTVANVKVSFDPGDGARDHTIDELLANMYSTDRPLRMRTLETLYGALEPLTPVLAHCYDSLVADRLVDDRLRTFDDADGAAQPVERARERGGRRDDGGDRVAPLDRAPLVPPQGRAARASPKLHLSDQYAPLDEGRAFSYDESRAIVRNAFARFSSDIEVGVGGVLRRPPRRRRAAPGQARGSLLRVRLAGLAGVHHAQLHRPAARRDDDGARARARHALHALGPAPVGALVPSRHRAGRGAVDVRRAGHVRLHDGEREGRGHALARWCGRSSSRASRPSSARR